MEVRIAVQDVGREIVLESAETPDAIMAKVGSALESGGAFSLVDEKGRRVIVPVAKLGFVEIAPSETRRVGFGGS